MVTVRVVNSGTSDVIGKVMGVPSGDIMKPHKVVEVRLIPAHRGTDFNILDSQYVVVKAAN